MIGEKGENRSVAKLYFLTLSTTAQFLLIDNSLFFILIMPSIISSIYLIFFSDEYFKLNLEKDFISNSAHAFEPNKKSDKKKKIFVTIEILRKIFIFNIIISHIIILIIFSNYIFNTIDIVDIRSPDLSFEKFYGLFTFNFCLVSFFLSGHFMEVLDEEKPRR